MADPVTDSGGVKVRGTCPEGHTHTTTAPKGRVTWTGPCPTCGKKLTARRLKAAQQSATPTDEPTGGPPGGSLVVKKASYRDAPPEQAPPDESDDEGEGEPSGDADADAGAGGTASDSADAGGDSIGGNPSVREDRRAEPDADGSDAGNDVRTVRERGKRGRFRRARGRRVYPGVPYGA